MIEAKQLIEHTEERWFEPIYQWFKEGLDAVNLCDAKALLDKLRR